MSRDWVAWHDAYDDPKSSLSQRVVEVRRQLAGALDRAPVGPIRIVSACAGEGRDAIPVLSAHPRANDVHALLVELDPTLADRARAAAPPSVEVRTGDASMTDTYADAVPAHIALFCGVFGNITDAEIHGTINTLSSLLAPGGEVLWTRHTNGHDLTHQIRIWFAEAGFNEQDFVSSPEYFAVGSHKLAETTTPASFEAGVTMFTFFR